MPSTLSDLPAARPTPQMGASWMRQVILGRQALPRVLARNLLWDTEGFLLRLFILVVRAGDRLFGPRFVAALIAPLLVPMVLRRLPLYPRFKRYREALPDTFWKEGPFRHFLRMIRTWSESLAVALLYDRLSSRAWARRMTVSGVAPQHLPGWGERPVILTFLHTGGFGCLRYWLRAQGVPAMSWLRSVPRVLSTYADGIRAEGDALYGFAELPHTFIGGNALRQAVRALQPGRVLIFSLEGAMNSENVITCEVEGNSLHLRDGAVRLAKRVNAILLPVSVHRIGPCRFEFHFGQPVPDGLLRETSAQGAMDHLAKQFWQSLKRDPSSIGWSTFGTLVPEEEKVWKFP